MIGLTRVERRRRVEDRAAAHKPLRRALGTFAAAVVRMPAVDPVTTELVRLRCAHHHDCGT